MKSFENIVAGIVLFGALCVAPGIAWGMEPGGDVPAIQDVGESGAIRGLQTGAIADGEIIENEYSSNEQSDPNGAFGFALSRNTANPAAMDPAVDNVDSGIVIDAVLDGLVEDDGFWYWYEDGRKMTGEILDGGVWRYFDPSEGGAMAVSRTVVLSDVGLPEGEKTVYYDESGAMAKGEVRIGSDWYFFDYGSGAMAVDHFVLIEDGGLPAKNGKKWVYYNEEGRMVKGEAYVNGGWYYFEPGCGAVSYGFVLLEDEAVEGGRKWVYYGPTMGDGRMRYGEQCIDGGWYYLTPGSGAVDYEWALIPDGAGGSKWVYYGPYMGDGRMRYGYQNVGDGWCNFNHTTGEVSYGMSYVTELGIWRYFDKGTGRWTADMKIRDWLGSSGGAYPSLAGCRNINVQVDLKNQVVLIREGSAVLYAMICSTGVNDCTPHGDFRVTGRGYSFYNSREGMGARYYVQFLGDYLFHSVPTDSSGNYIAGEGEKLGRPASHGCVRLTVSDAKWLYGNLPNGASVHIG